MRKSFEYLRAATLGLPFYIGIVTQQTLVEEATVEQVMMSEKLNIQNRLRAPRKSILLNCILVLVFRLLLVERDADGVL